MRRNEQGRYVTETGNKSTFTYTEPIATFNVRCNSQNGILGGAPRKCIVSIKLNYYFSVIRNLWMVLIVVFWLKPSMHLHVVYRTKNLTYYVAGLIQLCKWYSVWMLQALCSFK